MEGHPLQRTPLQGHLYILGAGGHGRDVAWAARQRWGSALALTFLVSQRAFLSGPVHGITVALLEEAPINPGDGFIAAVGDPGLRRELVAAAEARQMRGVPLVHPRAEVAALALIGEGSVIGGGTTVSVDTRIGRHVQVNVHCTIGHDAVLGDYVTLSPGVQVCGNVTLEAGVFVGAGAVIQPGSAGAPLTIGQGAVVAAGACVTGAVPAGTTVGGVPARELVRRWKTD